MLQINLFSRKDLTNAPTVNWWDICAFVLIAAIFFFVAWVFQKMSQPFNVGALVVIDLNPDMLPEYCLRSVARICLALLASLLFTFTFGYAAAKSVLAEKLIIPAIDVLQSVPVLGYLSVGVWGFLTLFPGSSLGPECAAILAIFTAQVWNMTLSFYQSLKMIPKSLKEAAKILHLSAWQRFWRLEVPYAVPSLLLNMMLSISTSWFFMVASEAIEVNNHIIMLPGIGSYIAEAIIQANIHALYNAILAMFCTILLYDQLFFRPMMQWSNKFTLSQNFEQNSSIIAKLVSRTLLFRFMLGYIKSFFRLVSCSTVKMQPLNKENIRPEWCRTVMVVVKQILIMSLLLLVIYYINIAAHFFVNTVNLAELYNVLWLGAVSSFRIFVLILLCILFWLPIGVWIGLRPSISAKARPIIQILAAFPANLFFPFFATMIISYDLNKDIWLSPLMILGTQWYVLFNVIVGAMELSLEQRYAVASLGLSNWLRWKRFILPGVFPHLLTGAITATGGAWNASIIAEAVNWGGSQLYATGLGSYIAYQTKIGSSSGLALGIVIMCFYVLLINRLLWQPLYRFSQRRFQ